MYYRKVLKSVEEKTTSVSNVDGNHNLRDVQNDQRMTSIDVVEAYDTIIYDFTISSLTTMLPGVFQTF